MAFSPVLLAHTSRQGAITTAASGGGFVDRPVDAERIAEHAPAVAPELALERHDNRAAGRERPRPPGVAVGDDELQVESLRLRRLRLPGSTAVGHHQAAAIDLDLDMHEALGVLLVREPAELTSAEGAGIELDGLGGAAIEAEIRDHAAHEGRVGPVPG